MNKPLKAKTQNRKLKFVGVLTLAAIASFWLSGSTQFGSPVLAEGPPESITIDASAKSTPFPHWWEHMFGSCRASLSLRESYRNDLSKVKAELPVDYVRFHGILHDDIGIYDEDKDGKPIYNFSYVDQVYDGLLDIGVRPFVEISFMPEKLAAKPELFGFWYKPNVAPPKDYAKWNDLMTKLAEHLIARYGIDEVSKWYFEVWNEPNIGFWAGEPKQESYFKLYDETAKSLKSVNTRIRVGGPSTAQAAWCKTFIDHCTKNNVPFDFVSTHVYGNDSSMDVFKTNENIPRRDMVARAMHKVYDEVKSSSKPDTPIIWSEFNASFFNEQNVTDSEFMGPWIANYIKQADGLADMVSFWTFSDVFEEGGVVKTPFYGGFGLIAAGNIPKASFNAFQLLHKLGEEKIANESNDALITRTKDGTVTMALWNYFAPEEKGESKKYTINLQSMNDCKKARIFTLDEDNGSALTLFKKMGQPSFPSREQQKELRKAAELGEPELKDLSSPKLELTLKPKALALIEFLK